MATKTPKPNKVEIWIFRGKHQFLKKSQGKVYGGIVSFKEADPTKPIVWLGQQSYIITNMANKNPVLFYDTLSGMLFRPKDMGNAEDSVDMVMQTSQNVLLAGRESKAALGIDEQRKSIFNFSLAVIILMTIMVMVFLYLFYTHVPTPGGTTNINTPSNNGNSGTGGLVPGTNGIIPVTGTLADIMTIVVPAGNIIIVLTMLLLAFLYKHEKTIK